MKAMNKAIRIISILMLVVLFVGAFSVPVLATNSDFSGIINTMQDKAAQGTEGENGIANLFGSIIRIMQVIGTGVAIIMLIVLAIKYLTASPEGKGEVKKSAAMYIVSAIVLFAAVNILAAIEGLSQGITTNL